MTRPRRTTKQQIAAEKTKEQKCKTRIVRLEARLRSEDSKKEDHRKILAGAAVLAHAKVNSRFRDELQKAFQAALTRDYDRAVLSEYLAESAPAPAPPARPFKSPGEPPSGATPA